MNLEEIRRSVSGDLTMDKTELDMESMKTPQLHNKYLIMYTDEKLVLGKMESDYRRLRKDKWLYYTGKMSQEQLDDRGWEPFALNLLKTDIDKFIESDDDIILQENKILLQKEKVEYLKSVVGIITNRQWLIRSTIDWIKFTNGS
tara:strand:+ start:7551 stop:7985 length:435 start_codon:yes stop_codon:yes gene_type:complete